MDVSDDDVEDDVESVLLLVESVLDADVDVLVDVVVLADDTVDALDVLSEDVVVSAD
ncbi:hypothetical protein [Telmatospirillum sp.]|uniref:hypothetical protein n=1 Tax=Telmatospirillum sp. TaxID=2079197 RepID=UPI002842337C|nr:hypothetical protein [Telmatospirillum sp.]MDR3436349.1 hypothetical protein [Telmatospirillum sp.]